MMTIRKYRGLIQKFSCLLSVTLMVTLLCMAIPAEAGVLFQSSWNHTTGSTKDALSDGGTWHFGSGSSGRLQDPIVYSNGPEGNNYLNLRTAGDGGWGSPYYINFDIAGDNDRFGDPDNFYCRVYVRVHQEWVENQPVSNHWFAASETGISSPCHHFLSMRPPPWPDYPDFFPNRSDWGFRLTVKPSAAKFASNITLESERWYCFEVHIQRIDAARNERWYFRLDGKDITNDFICFQNGSDGGYGKTLQEYYDDGGFYAYRYLGNFWMTTYDQETLNDGWDVAAIEVRDDRWPGPVGGGPTDTTPPTGSIDITGVEGHTDRTGTEAVTLTLSATDTGSGMSKMEFSRDSISWLGEEDYAASRQWTLLPIASGTEQSQTVYVKFKDVAGNWSSPTSASIVLDKYPPSAPSW